MHRERCGLMHGLSHAMGVSVNRPLKIPMYFYSPKCLLSSESLFSAVPWITVKVICQKKVRWVFTVHLWGFFFKKNPKQADDKNAQKTSCCWKSCFVLLELDCSFSNKDNYMLIHFSPCFLAKSKLLVYYLICPLVSRKYAAFEGRWTWQSNKIFWLLDKIIVPNKYFYKPTAVSDNET